ncbi:hypothetical protein [Clostridium sp. DL-VIII]|uniref:hypothetical protein n=1 Tax=Clostridium sp. DL-VIII TaxID=641107 RepID=UPI0005559B94|nr:hypothetical protein [Clostridium sp. DL-VIII]
MSPVIVWRLVWWLSADGLRAWGGLGLASKMAGPSYTSLLVPSKARLAFHSMCPIAKSTFELIIDDGIFS